MGSGDVIFALASGVGRSAIAVVRISGDGAGDVVRTLTGQAPPPARRATLRQIFHPRDGGDIDQALTLWFPGPASFTGEDVAEFHVHGGLAVVDALLKALSGISGCRPADAGEFTRRAFQNGKLDLAEAEGLADLIDAGSAGARRRAVWQLRGGLSDIYGRWRARLIEALALIEAGLDFSDEPVPTDTVNAALAIASEIGAELGAQLRAHPVQERLHDGLRVVLTGAPNVGKSSLLNALAGRDAAIVTAIPGTTRDVLEVRFELDGWPVSIYDTAGLRDADDEIELEGIRRARAAAADADLVVEVRDLTKAAVSDGVHDQRRLIFWNKADLAVERPTDVLSGSATSGEGLESLKLALTQAAKQAMEDEAPAITRARHRAALSDGLSALERINATAAPELIAEDLRLALRSLGRVVGAVDVEDVLDQLFSSFCIGK